MSLVAFLRLNGITQAQDYAVLPVLELGDEGGIVSQEVVIPHRRSGGGEGGHWATFARAVAYSAAMASADRCT